MSRISAIAAVLMLAVAMPAGLLADLTKAKAERNLDRRARLALENGALQLRVASQANKDGDWGKAKAALDELGESVDLAYKSQKETGRNPRSSRQYKDLEVRVRRLLKDLEGFRAALDFERREELSPLVKHIQEVHDEVLLSIMSPKGR